MSFAGYDIWKLRSDLDDSPREEPLPESDELERVYEQLHALQSAVLSCASFEYDPDASYDEGSWRDLTRYRLAFNRPGFEDLIEALDIDVKRGQSFEDAFARAKTDYVPDASPLKREA